MEAAIRSRNISALKSAQQAIKPNHSQQDVDIRTETDMVMRKVAASFVTDKVADAELHQFFNFVIECSENELCGKIVPVSVLQDILDVSSVERCEQLFSLVEDHIPTWKSPFFFEQCRNHVLRLCNDLLKRLSRTVDTAFCGRILVFLARCLPLTEKSGLNLVSQFNVDNSTRYEQEQTDQSLLTDNNDIEMEEGEMKDSNIPVDYALYCKFWQLQTFFSSPTTCYDKIGWKKFQHNANEVFSALASYKLEEGSGRKRHLDASISEPAGKSMKMDTSADNESATAIKLMANREQRRSLQTEKTRDSYFAKYLTSQKLLQLQLNDSEFRRYFLVQCIILFQYLQTDVKFKDKKVHSLADEQTRWIEDMAEKCYKLLRETHPDGARFAQAVKHIMDREKHWSEWKNQGCPDFTSMTDKEKMQMFKKRPKQRYDPNKIDLGNPELTKLWNIEPDTLASCRANPRRFIPRLEDFLVDPLDEMDPEQQVDEEYRSTNNEVFQWRAMRLLSMTSSQFFTPTNRDANLTKMTTFLESLIQRTAATIPQFGKQLEAKKEAAEARRKSEQVVSNGKSSADKDKNGESAVDAGEEMDDANADDHVDVTLPLVTDAHVAELAPLLADGWEALAKVLDFPQDTIVSYRKKNEPAAVAEMILTQWVEGEGDSATIKKLRNLILHAELFNEEVANVLSKDSANEESADEK